MTPRAPLLWPAEHIILSTIDGRVLIERRGPYDKSGPIDPRPFTGWERARRTQLPRATPAAGD